jgi:hypothetical protein
MASQVPLSLIIDAAGDGYFVMQSTAECPVSDGGSSWM